MEVAENLKFILKQNEKNKLSHAFLIETNNIDKCLIDVKEIVKIINESNDENNLSKLVDLNVLPSLIIIEPDGLNIKKAQLEELEIKFSTKPIYSKYNIYIIKNADRMNASASNTILKFLEEPENNIIGFLIVNNKENVLSTIKSRCEIAHVKYSDSKINDDNLLELVDLYLDKIYNTNDYLINKNLILSKYSERKDIEILLNEMFLKIHEKFLNSVDNQKMRNKYNKILEIIDSKIKLLKNNGNIELLLDSLVIEMRRTRD